MSLDLSQYHDTFFEESFEAIDSMEDALLRLAPGTPDVEVVNTIFRVAHSIKGGSATFGFSEVASFTHVLETLLDELRGQRMLVTQHIMDQLLASVDVMREMLRAVQSKGAQDMQRVGTLQSVLQKLVSEHKAGTGKPAAGAAPVAAAPVTAAPPATTPASAVAPAPAASTGEGSGWLIEFRARPQLLANGNDPLRMINELAALGPVTVVTDAAGLPPLADMNPEQCYFGFKVTLEKAVPRQAINDIFDWAEADLELKLTPLGVAAVEPAATAPDATAGTSAPAEVVSVEPAAVHAPVAAPAAGKASANSESNSIRVSIEKIDELMNTLGELVITQSMLCQLGDQVDGPGAERLRAGLAALDRNVRELQESVMQVRMLPIGFVFGRFPRMVRDLAQRLGKQVELKLTGGETELDKTMMEKIGDPMVHLVRNGIDHGLELPAVREAAGKPATGTLHLHAWHRGSTFVVEVSDDGAGLNTERIRRKAIEKGVIDADAQLSDREVNELIFAPGFSTADQATDVSGRGVGMDVVRRNIEGLGGTVEIHSTPGKGSRFVITLPLTLAIVDGQTIMVGDESYIVPLTAIIESLQLQAGMISTVHGHGEVVAFRGEYLPIVRLDRLFGSRRRSADAGSLLMIIEGEGRKVGICVDELLGQQQVVVKTLESNYGKVEGVAGATILGDGSVALILDVAALTRASLMRAAA